jgi:ergothioneine biosynthesis protein EgtB
MKALLKQLQILQDETINIVNSVPDDYYSQQFHTDLSPIGWHLGHCVFTESYWILDQLLDEQTLDESLKALYVPELSNKQLRGASIPDKDNLIKWAKTNQKNNRACLEAAGLKKTSHELLKEDFLFYFLIQHYSQHIETMTMVLTEGHLKNTGSEFIPSKVLKSSKQKQETISIKKGIYNIGTNDISVSYDNERPMHTKDLDSFDIAKYPVSNESFLAFMEADGYSIRKYWSDDGWKWKKCTQHTHPHHWQLNHSWYGVNHNGPYTLEPSAPVYGLSYFEAEAYANWNGARLPHEHEWEAAFKQGCLEKSAIAWEWCKNSFHPYEGFKAYPYEGYSAPYFDDKHYVLKGGSLYTKEPLKRASFRNYYTADKRHIFAGLRLIYD